MECMSEWEWGARQSGNGMHVRVGMGCMSEWEWGALQSGNGVHVRVGMEYMSEWELPSKHKNHTGSVAPGRSARQTLYQ